VKKIYAIALVLLIATSTCVGGLSYVKNSYDEYKSSTTTTQQQQEDNIYSQAREEINDTVDEVNSVKTDDDSINGIKSGVTDTLKWYNNNILSK
jgi:hypothetical protein